MRWKWEWFTFFDNNISFSQFYYFHREPYCNAVSNGIFVGIFSYKFRTENSSHHYCTRPLHDASYCSLMYTIVRNHCHRNIFAVSLCFRRFDDRMHQQRDIDDGIVAILKWNKMEKRKSIRQRKLEFFVCLFGSESPFFISKTLQLGQPLSLLFHASSQKICHSCTFSGRKHDWNCLTWNFVVSLWLVDYSTRLRLDKRTTKFFNKQDSNAPGFIFSFQFFSFS